MRNLEAEAREDYEDYCAYIGVEPLPIERWRKEGTKILGIRGLEMREKRDE